MKKFLLLFIYTVFTAGIVCAGEPFMDKALGSWVGYPIDAVIKYWGYPDDQKNIAGRNVYIWEEKSTYQDSTYERSTVKTDKKGRTYVDTYSSGGGVYEYSCKKFFEVNPDNIITSYQYKGNSCPAAYFLKAKSLVNPENNEWERRKIEKQMQKGK